MNDPQPISPRRRMQELQAIPDSQRTEEEWDELNELEIQLAPVNREGGPEPRGQRPGQGGRGKRPQQGMSYPPQGGNSAAPSHPKRPVKRFRKRPPKTNPNPQQS